MSRPTILFVPAATQASGGGHLSRCLALAAGFREAGWVVRFALPDASFAGWLGDVAWSSLAADADAGACGEVVPGGCELLVIDDYGRDEIFEDQARAWARRIAVFDDGTGRRHACDVLIDAAALLPDDYARNAPGAHCLRGPAYALVRPAIMAHRNAALSRRLDGTVRTILLSFGATDPAGATGPVLDALEQVLRSGIAITAVLSSQAPDLATLRARQGDRFTCLVDPPDMGAVLASADLAIGAGGVGAYERAALGLPSTILVTAANQAGLARMLVEAGAAQDGGGMDRDFASRVAKTTLALIDDPAARTTMGERAAALIDGRAVARIVIAALGHEVAAGGAEVRLRSAELSDEEWLLALQREPATRRFAIDPRVPEPDAHREWLQRMLTRRGGVLAIVEADGEPAGMVRLDRLDGTDEGGGRYAVSIAISTARHGQGIGIAALRLLRRLRPIAMLEATVLAGNAESLRLFAKAGYGRGDDGVFRLPP